MNKSAAIMLLVAALLILIGLVSKSWVTFGDGNIRFGPLGLEMCAGGRCVDVPGDKGRPNDLELVIVLGLITGFASVAAAGLYGGLTLANRPDKLPAPKLANLVFGLALFSFVFFIIRVLFEGKHGSPGWAGVPAIGGVILALVGLKKLVVSIPPLANMSQPMGYANTSQPMAPNMSQPMAPNMSQPMTPNQSQPMVPNMSQPIPAPPCPRCGAPLQFIADHQRWFCANEQQYV